MFYHSAGTTGFVHPKTWKQTMTVTLTSHLPDPQSLLFFARKGQAKMGALGLALVEHIQPKREWGGILRSLV